MQARSASGAHRGQVVFAAVRITDIQVSALWKLTVSDVQREKDKNKYNKYIKNNNFFTVAPCSLIHVQFTHQQMHFLI